jgi:hypothetical protein
LTSPILSSPVTLEAPNLWFGHIHLYEDEIVISGWTWTGPVDEAIPFSSVSGFEKWTVRKGQNFRLGRNGKPSIRGRIERGAELWASMLEEDERIKVKRRH